MTAANQSCKKGKSGDCWEVASQMPALLHTLVAIFTVKHEVVAIPRSTCNETIALLEALGASTIGVKAALEKLAATLGVLSRQHPGRSVADRRSLGL